MAPNKHKNNGHATNNNNYSNGNGVNGKTQKIKKPKTRNRDSGCCSINFIKYVLLIYNVVFLLSGIGVIATVVWTVFQKHQYISLLSSTNYLFSTYGLLLAGLLAVIGGIIGCCGVWRESRTIILLYTIVLLIVFLLELLSGSLAYIYETQVGEELKLTLNDTFMQNYGVNEKQTIAIDLMQQDYVCCGAVRFEEYQTSTWLRSKRKDLVRLTEGRAVPDSCCFSVSAKCGISQHPSNIPYSGCIYRFTEDVKEHLVIIGSVGLGICVIQIFGIILSCILYVKLKKLYDHKRNSPPNHLLETIPEPNRVSFYSIEEQEDEDELPPPPSSFSNRPTSQYNPYDRVV